MDKVDFKVDWCSHEAAKYACENWHYSKCIPKSKLFKLGIWENGKYIGCLIFGSGASAVAHKSYNLEYNQICELVRIALKSHSTPVSRIISISLKFLKNSCSDLILITSFADPNQNHHGGIYQATNWVYTGISQDTIEYLYKGRYRHVTAIYKSLKNNKDKIRELPSRKQKGKYRYLMPLTKEMRKQILSLSKPYPKRVLNAVEA